jgi:acetyltransferase-like isoleucine patch superfamily enzyme
MEFYTREAHPGAMFFGFVGEGEDVKIFPGAVIGRPPMVTGSIHQTPRKISNPTFISDGAVIGANVVIYEGVQVGKNVLIGDGATIRENTRIGEGAIIGSNATIQNDVTIGERSRVLDLSHITAHVTIGPDTFVSVGVLTMNDNSMARGGELNPPIIGKDVRIGGGAALLPGMQVGDGALIATGAVVTHPVGENIRVQGVPARPYGTTPKTDEQLWSEYYFDQSIEAGSERTLDGAESAD